MNVRQCVACPAKGLPDKAFRKADPETLNGWKRDGLRRIVARGLCKACYESARKTDALIDFERNTVSREDIREEWEHFADRTRPIKHECQRLAKRFGMDWQTLERAVYRSGIRSTAIA